MTGPQKKKADDAFIARIRENRRQRRKKFVFLREDDYDDKKHE